MYLYVKSCLNCCKDNEVLIKELQPPPSVVIEDVLIGITLCFFLYREFKHAQILNACSV